MSFGDDGILGYTGLKADGYNLLATSYLGKKNVELAEGNPKPSLAALENHGKVVYELKVLVFKAALCCHT